MVLVLFLPSIVTPMACCGLGHLKAVFRATMARDLSILLMKTDWGVTLSLPSIATLMA